MLHKLEKNQKKKHLMYTKRNPRAISQKNQIRILQNQQKSQIEKIFQESMLNNKQQNDLFILNQKIPLKQNPREWSEIKI